jgi:hypothetical protein
MPNGCLFDKALECVSRLFESQLEIPLTGNVARNDLHSFVVDGDNNHPTPTSLARREGQFEIRLLPFPRGQCHAIQVFQGRVVCRRVQDTQGHADNISNNRLPPITYFAVGIDNSPVDYRVTITDGTEHCVTITTSIQHGDMTVLQHGWWRGRGV